MGCYLKIACVSGVSQCLYHCSFFHFTTTAVVVFLLTILLIIYVTLYRLIFLFCFAFTVRKDNMEKALESEDVSKAKDRGKDTLDSDEDISPVEVLCDEVNDRREEKMEHGRTGSGEEKTVQTRKKRLVCKECGKIFTRRETFNLHRHFHTHEGELASLTCKECGLSFQHRSTLIKHRSEHKEKEQATNQKPRGIQLMTYPRERCKMTFSAPAKSNQRVCNSVPEKPYRCPLCRKEFFFKCSMTKHIQSHSLDVVFHCQECNKGFSNGIALRCHQRCHSALKPYECPDCGMVFRHYSVMEDRSEEHTSELQSR